MIFRNLPSGNVVSDFAVISQKFILYLSELWNTSYLSYKSRTSAKNSISEYADTQPRSLHYKVHHDHWISISINPVEERRWRHITFFESAILEVSRGLAHKNFLEAQNGA